MTMDSEAARPEMCEMCGRVVYLERVARASEYRLRMIMERAPFGVALLDGERRILWMNHYALGTLGLDSLETIKGHDFLERARPDEKPLHLKLFQRTLKRPGESTYNGVLHLKTSWENWVRVEVSTFNLLEEASINTIAIYWRIVES